MNAVEPDRYRSQDVKGKFFKQTTSTAHPEPVRNDYVAEALAKQAASRPPKTPPKAMPVTPTLPRVRKSKRPRKPQA
jgi:hypothetical protein